MREALSRAKVNLASECKRREVEVVKGKEELAKMEKRVGEEAIKVYKACTNFMAKKAQTVVVFHMSKEFYADHCQLNKEALYEGFKLGKDTIAPKS